MNPRLEELNSKLLLLTTILHCLFVSFGQNCIVKMCYKARHINETPILSVTFPKNRTPNRSFKCCDIIHQQN